MITSHYENAVPEFLDTAVAELGKLRQQITPDYFAPVADLINASETYGGRVHLTGIGKSEYVANYIAALFASTAQNVFMAARGKPCAATSWL